MTKMMTMVVCVATFATLSLVAPHTADACTEPPPGENECGSLQIGDTTIVAMAAVTRPTTQTNCTCANGWTGFAPGAKPSDGLIVDERGVPLDSFCMEGPSDEVGDVLSGVFGSSWFATANALSKLGVTGGRRAYSILQIENNPKGVLPAALAQAQLNFVNGALEIDSQHQVVTKVPDSCTVCTQTSTDAVCNVLATATAYLDGPLGGQGPAPSTLVERAVCARTGALNLLGVDSPEGDEETEDAGGCNASGASAGAFVLVFGLGVAFAHRGRRGVRRDRS